MTIVEHVRGKTFHSRKGTIENRFRYGVDYVLLDADEADSPSLFSKNNSNVFSVHDTDHGGPRGLGRGVAWVRDILSAHELPGGARILLLAQPRVFGRVFNPVSFWLCYDDGHALRVVIAEVSNTFGDRHSYLCCREDHEPLRPEDTVRARKIFHVSPFLPVEGDYAFRFDIRPDRLGVWIDFTAGTGGLVATLIGDRRKLTNMGIVLSCLRRPFGSHRVTTLIYWQALKLWVKGAPFRKRPVPPINDVSR